MTLERVTEWLAAQELGIREEVAKLLAGDIEALRDEVRASARKEGEADGRAAGEAAWNAAADALQQAVAELQGQRERDSEQLVEDCADVIAEALAKIAGPVLSSRDAIVGAVREVVKRVKDDGDVRLRVHAGQLDLLKEAQAELEQMVTGQLTIAADSRVELGGCIVESELGSLDGRLEVQMRQLFETLKAAQATGKGPK